MEATTLLGYDLETDHYWYKVEIKFPGTYENNTVGSSISINTGGESPFNISIQFSNASGKISEDGITLVTYWFDIDSLPWGNSEANHISIDVSLTEENNEQIEGGGVVHQGQASSVSRPFGSETSIV